VAFSNSAPTGDFAPRIDDNGDPLIECPVRPGAPIFGIPGVAARCRCFGADLDDFDPRCPIHGYSAVVKRTFRPDPPTPPRVDALRPEEV
jgi:hypothetical protein